MRRFALLLLLLGPYMAGAQTGPIVRAKFVPAGSAIVGEPVRLQVEILVPNFFTGAPEFPAFDMDGAIVTLSDDRPEHFNEQVNRATFAGIRRFYLIYAEQPGTFALPAVVISVPYAAKPPETTVANLQLPPMHLSAILPPQARNLDYFLPTSRLTLTQQWSKSISQLRAGDSASRTITVTTQKAKAMLIPPIAFSVPDGVSVYLQATSVDDEKNATGAFTRGVRTERATYVFARPGDYVLPEIEITWWNLSSRKLITAKLPSAEVHVTQDTAYRSEVPPEAETAVAAQPATPGWRSYLRISRRYLPVFVLTAVLAWIFWRCHAKLVAYCRSSVARHRDSEAGHWHRLTRALSANDASRSYTSLLAWLRRLGLPLAVFQSNAGDPLLDRQIELLARTLFEPAGITLWNGRALQSSLTRHRRFAAASAAKSRYLPPLNPN